MPRMNVGDKVRCIDDRLGDFFTVGEIYTVATSEPLWPDGHQNAKKFTFVEIPHYTWVCDHIFEEVLD
jgi:hypothetical protein